jgi:Protein of unknown function (DUF3375)
MDFLRLKSYLDSAPMMRLLRAGNAAYTVAFLHRQFKQLRKISIAHSDLLPALASFREEIQEYDADAFRDKPETYLTDWCEKQWLRRLLEAGRNEPVYQLTSHSEEVIEFVDHALHRDSGFVGTESRLRTIIALLDELVVGASSDPQVHLERLHRDRAAIDEQINRIESGGLVAQYGPTRIREQFATAVDLLKQLQRDFRAVEDKFREITQRVQHQHVSGFDSRGEILGEALDSEDALKKEDQGISFFEFLRFIQSPEQQSRLQIIIQELQRIQELADQTDGLETVRRMVVVLLAEAEKVMQTTRRLSSTLRRLLDTRVQHERRRLVELLREIRGLAVVMNEAPPRSEVGLEVDAELEIGSPLSRTDWYPPAEFRKVDLTEHVPDEDTKYEAFREYATLRPIDWLLIRSHVDAALSEHEQLTLAELVKERHPRAKVLDLIAYMETAQEQGHSIDRTAREELIVTAGPVTFSGQMRVSVPLITFSRSSNHGD